MRKDISINLDQVFSKNDLYEVFLDIFDFPSYFGKNWDAFEEILPEVLLEKMQSENIDHIHLIFNNYASFIVQFPPSDRGIFESILRDIDSSILVNSPEYVFSFEMISPIL